MQNNFIEATQNKTPEYLKFRKELFETTILDMVEHICEELINHDKLVVAYNVDDKKASITIKVPKKNIRDIVGKRSETLIAIKKLAFSVANKHDFYLTIRLEELC
jgi:predicted RNA-binding protein YlqC (UPF0109 family)